jgi:hypothetical protein
VQLHVQQSAPGSTIGVRDAVGRAMNRPQRPWHGRHRRDIVGHGHGTPPTRQADRRHRAPRLRGTLAVLTLLAIAAAVVLLCALPAG